MTWEAPDRVCTRVPVCMFTDGVFPEAKRETVWPGGEDRVWESELCGWRSDVWKASLWVERGL